jgi:hypothetical protein
MGVDTIRSVDHSRIIIGLLLPTNGIVGMVVLGVCKIFVNIIILVPFPSFLFMIHFHPMLIFVETLHLDRYADSFFRINIFECKSKDEFIQVTEEIVLAGAVNHIAHALCHIDCVHSLSSSW